MGDFAERFRQPKVGGFTPGLLPGAGQSLPRPSLLGSAEGAATLAGFDFGKSDLKPGHREILAGMAETYRQLLASSPAGKIRAVGHTDTVGSEADNDALGQARADAVGAELATLGLDSSAIEARSLGEAVPTVESKRPEPANRRVELYFMPGPDLPNVLPAGSSRPTSWGRCPRPTSGGRPSTSARSSPRSATRRTGRPTATSRSRRSRATSRQAVQRARVAADRRRAEEGARRVSASRTRGTTGCAAGPRAARRRAPRRGSTRSSMPRAPPATPRRRRPRRSRPRRRWRCRSDGAPRTLRAWSRAASSSSTRTRAKVRRVIALQYNPEKLTRSLKVPPRRRGRRQGRGAAPARPRRGDVPGRGRDRRRRPAGVPRPEPRHGRGRHRAAARGARVAGEPDASPTCARRQALAAQGTLEIAPMESAARDLRLGREPDRAGAGDRLLDHRGGVRPGAEPDPGQGRASGLRVLTVDDLGFDHKGGGLFMAYLQSREKLAARAATFGFETLGIGGLP